MARTVLKIFLAGNEFHKQHTLVNKITPSDLPEISTALPTDEFRAAGPAMTKWRLKAPSNAAGSDQLFKVELALARLENGDYGYCVLCDDEIGIPELEADPSTILCSGCRTSDH